MQGAQTIRCGSGGRSGRRRHGLAGGRHKHHGRTIFAWKGVDVEVVRLDRQGLLELKLVCRIAHDEIKALEDGDECELYFLPGEGAALYQKEGFLL